MKQSFRIRPASIAVGLVGALALMVIVGIVGAQSPEIRPEPTSTLTTRAALPAADIVNIAGRKGGTTPPGGSIYTVPPGRTLVIRSVTMVGYSNASFQGQPVGFNLNCGGTLLIPREVAGSTFGFATGNAFDLGWVCPQNTALTLTGPAVNPLYNSVGWMLLGELQ
ncbi:MAG: hypothetical protein OEV00_08300 [Acidobacteriota bacterium]|nr:hypothetical protein [Acidobacteriota bacterium]MDH3785312.1 hypothetical protein [Acidobacteriota bacterium]